MRSIDFLMRLILQSALTVIRIMSYEINAQPTHKANNWLPAQQLLQQQVYFFFLKRFFFIFLCRFFCASAFFALSFWDILYICAQKHRILEIVHWYSVTVQYSSSCAQLLKISENQTISSLHQSNKKACETVVNNQLSTTTHKKFKKSQRAQQRATALSLSAACC